MTHREDKRVMNKGLAVAMAWIGCAACASGTGGRTGESSGSVALQSALVAQEPRVQATYGTAPVDASGRPRCDAYDLSLAVPGDLLAPTHETPEPIKKASSLGWVTQVHVLGQLGTPSLATSPESVQDRCKFLRDSRRLMDQAGPREKARYRWRRACGEDLSWGDAQAPSVMGGLTKRTSLRFGLPGELPGAKAFPFDEDPYLAIYFAMDFWTKQAISMVTGFASAVKSEDEWSSLPDSKLSDAAELAACSGIEVSVPMAKEIKRRADVVATEEACERSLECKAAKLKVRARAMSEEACRILESKADVESQVAQEWRSAKRYGVVDVKLIGQLRGDIDRLNDDLLEQVGLWEAITGKKFNAKKECK